MGMFGLSFKILRNLMLALSIICSLLAINFLKHFQPELCILMFIISILFGILAITYSMRMAPPKWVHTDLPKDDDDYYEYYLDYEYDRAAEKQREKLQSEIRAKNRRKNFKIID